MKYPHHYTIKNKDDDFIRPDVIVVKETNEKKKTKIKLPPEVYY